MATIAASLASGSWSGQEAGLRTRDSRCCGIWDCSYAAYCAHAALNSVKAVPVQLVGGAGGTLEVRERVTHLPAMEVKAIGSCVVIHMKFGKNVFNSEFAQALHEALDKSLE